jgi:arsenite methyltransferase
LLERAAEELELPDASVDVIVSNLGINNFKNVDAVLRTLFQVATPDARLFLTTNLEGHMAEFYDVFRETLVELGQTHRLVGLEEHVRKRGTVDSIGDTLLDAGFAVVNAETEWFRMRFVDGSAMLRHHFVRLGFVQEWKALVAAEQLHRTFETLERNLNTVAARQGELVLTVPMALIEARKQVFGDPRSARESLEPKPEASE